LQDSVNKLVDGLNAAVEANEEDFKTVQVVVAPTFVHIPIVMQKLNPLIKVAAQDLHFTHSGAYTGEVSADQLKDLGVEWVIIGHSERRAGTSSNYGVMAFESPERVQWKVSYALSRGMSVIICCGETLHERKAEVSIDICKTQLWPVVRACPNAEEWERIVIAYEPVWAIGTGVSASKEDAEVVHSGIRTWLAKEVSKEVAQKVRIQYGGSVSPKNCVDLAQASDIDGFLVGGAALAADSFASIVSAGARFGRNEA